MRGMETCPFGFKGGDNMDDARTRLLYYWMDEWGYKEPESYYSMKRYQFRQRCLDHWAAMEVLEEVKKHPKEDPITVIEMFRDRVGIFCCTAKTEQANDFFIVLYDAATNALDYLIELKERNS